MELSKIPTFNLGLAMASSVCHMCFRHVLLQGFCTNICIVLECSFPRQLLTASILVSATWLENHPHSSVHSPSHFIWLFLE